MAINNGKGNILLSCDHVTAYLSISFVERESRSQKDQKCRSSVQTEGLPCFDLSAKKLGIIIYYLNVLRSELLDCTEQVELNYCFNFILSKFMTMWPWIIYLT